MARPKTKAVGGRPRAEDPKRSLVSLKGGKRFADWLDKLSEFTHLPPTILMEHALRVYAEQQGFPDPQPKR